MTQEHCPHCGVALPAVHDAFLRKPAASPWMSRPRPFCAAVKQDSFQANMEEPHDEKIGMTAEQTTGRTASLWYFILILSALSLFTAIDSHVNTPAMEGLRAPVVRFVLNASAAALLALPRKHYRQVDHDYLVSRRTLLGVVGLKPGGDPLGLIIVVAMAVGHMSFMVMLIASPSLNAFLSHQRGEQEPAQQTLQ